MSSYKKGKNVTVEFMRFFAAISILFLHSHVLISDISNNLCLNGWLYVEFFLILTGYFTAKHFEKVEYEREKLVERSLKYTYLKFKPMIPYIIITVIGSWVSFTLTQLIYSGESIVVLIYKVFKQVPFEILLLPSRDSNFFVIPLWYLSALLIVFPIVVLFVQIRNRYVVLWGAILYSVVYYGVVGIVDEREIPFCWLRIIGGLMLGIALFEGMAIIQETKMSTGLKYGKALAIILFAFLGVLIYFNVSMKRSIVLGFLFCLGSLFANKDKKPKDAPTNDKSSLFARVMLYLGEISMPMYILHWFVAMLIGLILPKLAPNIKMILFVILTIVLSTTCNEMLKKTRS